MTAMTFVCPEEVRAAILWEIVNIKADPRFANQIYHEVIREFTYQKGLRGDLLHEHGSLPTDYVHNPDDWGSSPRGCGSETPSTPSQIGGPEVTGTNVDQSIQVLDGPGDFYRRPKARPRKRSFP